MMGMITDLRLVQKPANLLQYVIKTNAYLLFKICLLMQRGIFPKQTKRGLTFEKPGCSKLPQFILAAVTTSSF